MQFPNCFQFDCRNRSCLFTANERRHKMKHLQTRRQPSDTVGKYAFCLLSVNRVDHSPSRLFFHRSQNRALCLNTYFSNVLCIWYGSFSIVQRFTLKATMVRHTHNAFECRTSNTICNAYHNLHINVSVALDGWWVIGVREYECWRVFDCIVYPHSYTHPCPSIIQNSFHAKKHSPWMRARIVNVYSTFSSDSACCRPWVHRAKRTCSHSHIFEAARYEFPFNEITFANNFYISWAMFGW